MNQPIPLLFLSDAPHLTTGLSRITKDLALIASSLPEFRVGTLGRGGYGNSKLPFMQYNFHESGQWGEDYLEDVWKEFSGGKYGVLFSVWDISRLCWLGNPVGIGGRLGEFLSRKPFHKWIYAQIDGYGVGGKLTSELSAGLGGFDRVLAYSMFGKGVMEQTLGREIDWIPHGYDAGIWKPRGKVAGRMTLGLEETDLLIGMVATNQLRKDWATAFAAISIVKNHFPHVKFWAHTDVINRHWNLLALMDDFGLNNTVKITISGQFNSEQLSYLYSACDMTILPSCEGFGYPIVESMACGVPALHGSYGGGAELIPVKEWQVEPETTRLDGAYNIVRPVWDPQAWANAIMGAVSRGEHEVMGDVCTSAVEHLAWKNLAPVWRKWMLEGIGHGQ